MKFSYGPIFPTTSYQCLNRDSLISKITLGPFLAKYFSESHALGSLEVQLYKWKYELTTSQIFCPRRKFNIQIPSLKPKYQQSQNQYNCYFRRNFRTTRLYFSIIRKKAKVNYNNLQLEILNNGYSPSESIRKILNIQCNEEVNKNILNNLSLNSPFETSYIIHQQYSPNNHRIVSLNKLNNKHNNFLTNNLALRLRLRKHQSNLQKSLTNTQQNKSSINKRNDSAQNNRGKVTKNSSINGQKK